MTETVTAKSVPTNMMVEHCIPVVYKVKGFARVKVPLNASEEDIEEALEDYPLEQMEDIDFPPEAAYEGFENYWQPQISEHFGMLPALAEVFSKLDAEHNIAAVASECCNGDSCTVGEELLGSDLRYVGFVYIHQQNIENIAEDGTFAIGFAAREVEPDPDNMPTTDAHAVIGGLLRESLDDAGFTTEWDGTADRKVEITGYQG